MRPWRLIVIAIMIMIGSYNAGWSRGYADGLRWALEQIHGLEGHK